MATLQKIRSKGTLLLVVIGLALLAFILGDAWKILRPNQGVTTVGEVNGKNVDAQEYQHEFEKYSEIVKFSMNTNSLSDEEYASVKDETWNMMLRKSLVNKEASAIGLKVTDAEIQSIVEAGTNPMLRQTPFQNAQTGAFDVDYLKGILAAYNELDRSSMPAEVLNQYDNLYNYWCFIEDNLRQNSLISKYAALLQNSVLSNPVSRKDSYESRTKRSDIVVAMVPYSSVADSLANVTSADIKSLYTEKKSLYKQEVETRSINYIDVEILPSDADRTALQAEVSEYAAQLADTEEEIASFIRLTQSEYPYSEVPFSKNGYPQNISSMFDSVKVGEVYGPYYSADDDTYNAFKILSTVSAFDSIQYAAIQVPGASADEVAALEDSIYSVILAGADMAEIAAKYSQDATPQWLTSAAYEGAAYSGDNALYLNKLLSMNKGEVSKLDLDQVSLIIKVYDQKNKVEKYNAAVIKRQSYFSNETSNETYNKLSAFVASNNTAELLAANAEDNGYRLLTAADFRSDNNNVGGVAKSHEALRWAFDAKPGEVSRIYEVGDNNDHLLVVALNKINKQGYIPVEDLATALTIEALQNKKAEIIKSQISAAGGDVAKITGAKIDTVKYVTFAAPSYVSSTFTSEPLLAAAVANLEQNTYCAPVKGEGGVWVAKKISSDTHSAEFDEEDEKDRVVSNNAYYLTNMFLSVLYDKADVTDNRYKIF